jgi:hypothetical protein
MATTMTLTQLGATTIDLNDQADAWKYRIDLDTWAPKVARRTAKLLSDTPYEEVMEVLRVNIGGATKQEVYNNQHALVVMFDQARRFAQAGTGGGGYGSGGTLNPVIWNVQMDGAATLKKCMVIPAIDDPDCVVLPSTFMTDTAGRVVRSVQIQFRRKPLMVPASETTGTTAATAIIGTVQTSVLASAADVASPTRINLGNSSFIGSLTAGLAVITEDDGSFTSLATAQCSGAGASGAWTTPNDAANFAFATNVLRYTPTLTSRVVSGNITLNVAGTLLLILEVRNNTSGKEYVVDVEVKTGSRWIRTRAEVVGGSNVAAGYVILGVVSAPASTSVARLGVQAASTGGTIDFDRLIAVRLGTANTSVIQHGVVTGASFTSVGSGQYLNINHRYLYDLAPYVWLEGTGLVTGVRESPETLDANPFVLTKLVNVRALYLAYDGSNDWAPNGGGLRMNTTMTAYRLDASLAPR